MQQTVRCLVAILCLFPFTSSGVEHLRLATTTSTENSGLLAMLHPPFERQFGVKVDVIAVGTGRALRLGKNGDVDLVMVHAPAAERDFVANGLGVERLPLMHNDFVILGPPTDLAKLSTLGSVREVMQRLSEGRFSFVSRGDQSGTHRKEIELWQMAGQQPRGRWYLSVGQGMNAALQIADNKSAYVLSDRGSWLIYRDKSQLELHYQGDPALHNPYHLIIVNPVRHPHIQYELAKKYVDYARGRQGQTIIREFRKSGEALFKPDVIR